MGNVTVTDRQRYVVLSSKKGGMQIYDGATDFMSATLVASFDTAQDFKNKFESLPLKEGLPYAYLAGLVVEDIIRVDYQGKTVREIAQIFKVSKSTVHKDLHERLIKIDKDLSEKVDKILKYHIDIRHIRGGESTKRKYLKMSNC